MRIVLSPKAEKQLRKLSKVDQIIIGRKIRTIGSTKKVSGEEKLKGYRNVYRVRVGSYRLVYKRTKNTLHIVLIGHRKDIYDLVDRVFK